MNWLESKRRSMSRSNTSGACTNLTRLIRRTVRTIASAFLVGVFLTLLSCAPSGSFVSNNSAVADRDTSLSKTTAALDYYQPVRTLKQPNTMACWATALTVLYSWKTGLNSIPIADVLKPYGKVYVDAFNNNSGLAPSQAPALFSTAHMTMIQGVNPTIQYWYDLLNQKGPLMIIVAYQTINGKKTYHALVMNGMSGDGSPGGTFIDYVDPADGQQHTDVVFTDFIALYEGAANWPLQIVHW